MAEEMLLMAEAGSRDASGAPLPGWHADLASLTVEAAAGSRFSARRAYPRSE
jgi:hypothetical protein